MTVTIQRFMEMVTEVGLASDVELRTALERSAAEGTEHDVRALAGDLVRSARLTDYQARQLLDGQGIEIGQYVLLDKIADGGMGQVYKARHRTMGRLVALKVIHEKGLVFQDTIERFQREIRALAELQHPHVVTAFDAGERNGAPYLVMEFMEGVNLSQAVRGGRFAVQKAIDCIRQAALGLKYIHDRGIIHRDIKPSNLLLDRNGLIKIVDLGLARLADWRRRDPTETAAELTVEGQIMGTVDFMAPEQFSDTHNVDQRTDIYGLGCTLFHLLVGRPPFGGATRDERLVVQRERPAASLSDSRPDVPAALEEVFQKMVARRPEDRFASAQELIDALDRIGIPGADDPLLATTVLWRPPGRNTSAHRHWKSAAIAAALLVALLPIAIGRLQLRRQQDPSAAVPDGGSARLPSPRKHPEPKDEEREPEKIPAERAAALWVLDRSGSVDAIVGTSFLPPIKNAAELPSTPFRIHRIGLGGRRLSEGELKFVEPLTDLEWLDIAHTDITDDDLASVAGLTKLQTLYLAETSISDDGLVHLAELKNLRNLDLRSTRVTDKGLKRLAQDHALTSLILGGTQETTDEGLSHLRFMQSLTSLGLRGTKVTDRGMQDVAELRNLKWIDLGLTNVSDQGIAKLGSLDNLGDLLLDGAVATGNGFPRKSCRISR